MEKMRFDGRVAIVTGARQGLGLAYAEFLAARGATVALNDLPPTSESDVLSARDRAAEIRSAGGDADMIFADVGDETAARGLVEQVLQKHGRVDILIHNAGRSLGTLDEHLNVHLRGAVWLTQAVWPGMIAQRFGRILLTTSGVGLFGAAARGDATDSDPTSYGEMWLYGVAKIAEVGLTRHLAIRGETANIRVNTIAPVALTASMIAASKNMPDTPRLKWIRESCTPEMVAPVAGYLVHEDCAVSGEIIRASGRHVGRIFIAEGPGVDLDEVTIEAVRDRLDEVCAEAGYDVPKKSRSFTQTSG